MVPAPVENGRNPNMPWVIRRVPSPRRMPSSTDTFTGSSTLASTPRMPRRPTIRSCPSASGVTDPEAKAMVGWSWTSSWSRDRMVSATFRRSASPSVPGSSYFLRRAGSSFEREVAGSSTRTLERAGSSAS